jgi:triphosphatase
VAVERSRALAKPTTTEDERQRAEPAGDAEALRAGPGREIELKLAVPSGDLARLRRHPLVRALAQGKPEKRRLHTTYYDTSERDLARAELALRVRRDGDAWIQALKGTGSSIGGLFVRGEWESEVPGPEPDLTLIPSFAAQALARRAAGSKPLEPIFETDFVRTSFRLVRDDTELCLDFDEGEIRARGRSAPIREVELELVRGDPGVLHGMALELHESVPVRPALESKAERGHALATGARRTPRRAARVALPPAATLEDALRAVLAACLEQVLANLEPAREPADGEGVHQLRVGLRRTRAALALFRACLPAEQTEAFKGELRWLAGELGPARDLDVFLTETLDPIAARFPDDAVLKRLRDAARELRDDAYVRARAAIDAPRTAALCLALGGWITGAAWRAGADEEGLAALAAPAAARGAELLEARAKKARKLGRGLARRTAPERHRLRIELKKVRYAGEFLASVFPERAPNRWLRRLAELQDSLGALNDVATAERLLSDIAARLGREWGTAHDRGAGFLLGWIGAAAERRLGRLERQWKAFRKARPFWRA